MTAGTFAYLLLDAKQRLGVRSPSVWAPLEAVMRSDAELKVSGMKNRSCVE